jgi:hypothetical protein
MHCLRAPVAGQRVSYTRVDEVVALRTAVVVQRYREQAREAARYHPPACDTA